MNTLKEERKQFGTEAAFWDRILALSLDNYHGFSYLKAFLKHQKSLGLRNVPRLMLKYVKADTFPPEERQLLQNRPDPVENVITAVSFTYEDNPLPGWRRELVLRLSGKSAGRLEVQYSNPQRDRHLKSFGEVQTYFEEQISQMGSSGDSTLLRILDLQENYCDDESRRAAVRDTLKSAKIRKLFDFNAVFCICQCSEDPYRNYIECSYGKIGCSRWIHPECVGLGSRAKHELDTFPKVVCPFCTAYIRGCKTEKYVPPNYKLLDQFSTGYVFNDTYLPNNELIEETDCPHRIWGLTDFQKTYWGQTGIVGRIAFTGTGSQTSGVHSNTVDPDDVEILNEEQHISQWRRRLYDWRRQRWITVGLTGGYIVGENEQTDHELMRQRIKAKVQERNRSVESSQRLASSSSLLPPVMRCKTTLDELICRSVLHPQLHKKRQLAGSHLFNFAPIAFNNLEDGGIRIITAVTSTKSLHDLCKNGVCGLCFQQLALASSAESEELPAKSSKGRPKDDNHDSHPQVPVTELSNFGAVSYELHRHCAFLVSKEEELMKAITRLFPFCRIKKSETYFSVDSEDGGVEDRVDSESNNEERPSIVDHQEKSDKTFNCRVSKYFYDDIDDGTCYYCQKPGAVLLVFEVSDKEYTLHLLCLFSFLRYRHLETSVPTQKALLAEHHNDAFVHSSREVVEGENRDGRNVVDYLSNAPKCRCMICGLRNGHILRCCGASCHIRAHLICASSTKEWKIVTLSQAMKRNTNKVVDSIGFVCSTHRLFDSTIEDEEELDYFQK